MATGNFDACLKVTLPHEGGWSDHPKDPGGATMKGITIGRYRQYYPNATKADLRSISDADLKRIYHGDYWLPIKGDSLPYGVDLATFDFGVNSGPTRAAKYLQGVLGVKQDGLIGPETMKAAILADGDRVIKAICARRLSFVQGLSTFKVFGKGWSRRIADVEAKAVSMWLARGKPLSDADRERLRDEAATASAKATAQNSGASTGGVVAGGGAVFTDSGWVAAAIVAVLIAGAIVLVVKARQNKARAEAFRAEASK